MRTVLKPGEQIFGRYTVVRLLGEGGEGVVYAVRELEAPERMLALKLLDRAQDPRERERFVREMEVIARLKSPHTVQLVASGVEEDRPWMALEYVEGRTLDAALVERGALPPDLVRHLFVQILGAVAEAHEWGIVHRDLKPHNIMLSGAPERPQVKVLDFGTAGIEAGFGELGDHKNITLTGEVRGTPNYMAPEQVTSFDEPRVETDVYALGLILAECLTGERIVDGPTVESILFMHVKRDLELPASLLEGPFGPIIEKATRKKPEERFPLAGAMLAWLQRVSEDGLRLEEATFDNQSTTTIDPAGLLGEEELAGYREALSGATEMIETPEYALSDPTPTPPPMAQPARPHGPGMGKLMTLPPPPPHGLSTTTVVLIVLVVMTLVAAIALTVIQLVL